MSLKTAEEQGDVLLLLEIVEQAVKVQAIQAPKKFPMVHQGEDESLAGHVMRFTTLKNRTEALYATILPSVPVANSTESDPALWNLNALWHTPFFKE